MNSTMISMESTISAALAAPAPATPAATESAYVGIGEAASVLGLSRTSVQKLVDDGRLAAMKTTGGHRRIQRTSLLSLRDEMSRRAAPPAAGTDVPASPVVPLAPRKGLEVLIVDDDEVAITFLSGLIARHLPGCSVTVAREGVEAVLQLERRRPDLLVTDLNMRPFDGFRLAWLIHVKAEYRGIHMLAITALSDKEIERRGGLPPDVVLYRKPLPAERLVGYLEAHAQMRNKGPRPR